MISSLLLPRSWRILCSPSTQRTESATFDFPAPFGPTTAVTPVLNSKVVLIAKLLKPSISKRLRYTVQLIPSNEVFNDCNDDTTAYAMRRDSYQMSMVVPLSRQFLGKNKTKLNSSRNSQLSFQIHLCWCLIVKR